MPDINEVILKQGVQGAVVCLADLLKQLADELGKLEKPEPEPGPSPVPSELQSKP